MKLPCALRRKVPADTGPFATSRHGNCYNYCSQRPVRASRFQRLGNKRLTSINFRNITDAGAGHGCSEVEENRHFNSLENTSHSQLETSRKITEAQMNI